MAIKNLFGRGIGFGEIHWIVTRGYESGTAPPAPTVVPEIPGGGRRIYDPDDHTTKTRPFTKKERAEWDKWFGERVAPRYVAPEPVPVSVQKRLAPLPVAVPEPEKPLDRITAAKQFMALDAIESLFDRFEYQPDAQARIREHQAALAHAERLRLEMERREQARIAWEASEQQRIADEDDEMMSVLLAIHELT